MNPPSITAASYTYTVKQHISVYAEIYLMEFMPLANPAKIESVFLFVERFQESGNVLAHFRVSVANFGY